MSFAYMPLFTGDYIRDTQHLSCAEHGIYLKLLMHCWDVKGPAPLDERKRCGIVNARSGDEVEALRRVMNEFFVQMEDGWYNERMQNEVVKSEMLSKSRSEYGRTGAAIKAQSQVRRAKEAQAKHKLSTSQAQAKHEPLSSSSSSSLEVPVLNPVSIKQRIVGSRSEKTATRAARLKPEWKLPKPWGQWAMEKFPQMSEADVRLQADNFRDYWIGVPGQRGVKLDWYATWRNSVRRAVQLGIKQQGAGSSNWWASNAGIDAKGRELGLTARGGESYDSYKNRIFEHLKAEQ